MDPADGQPDEWDFHLATLHAAPATVKRRGGPAVP